MFSKILKQITLSISMLLPLLAVCQHTPRVQDLLERMTLEEKIGQLNQYSAFWDVTGPPPAGGLALDKFEQVKAGLVGSMLNVKGVQQIRKVQELAVEQSRLGIPLIFALDVIHGYRTAFPIPLAESCSWNLELMERTSRVAAIEAAAAGLNWTFAPMIDLSREPRWGRVMEGAGEDPWLLARVAGARVRGFQGNDLAAVDTIAACAKHFVGYGFPAGGRDYNTVDLDGRTLHNMILPPFKAAVDAKVLTVMNAFNLVGGIPATAHRWLQRDLLKGEWGFNGFVVSDWGSVAEIAIHGAARDLRHSAELAMIAGSDMDMEGYGYIRYLADLVRVGRVPESAIDEAAGRILAAKEALGLFDDPYRYLDEAREDAMLEHPDHLELALMSALQSMVLLKNEDSLLPLSPDAGPIAVIGALAADKDSPLGNWRAEARDDSAVSVLEGMRNLGVDFRYAEGVKVNLNRAGFTEDIVMNETDRSGFEEAIALAEDAAVVIMVLGENAFHSGESRSRAELGMPGLQAELLKAVHAVNPNIVLVLNSGRPLTISWEAENIPAILAAWQGGSRAGDAIARLLFGEDSPSGKLTMTWPRSVGQIPVYYNHDNTGRPSSRESIFWSRYIDESREPLFPFGHGLTYSQFEYSGLNVLPIEPRQLEVSLRVRNSSDRAATEIAQLYLRDPVATVVRPIKELRGFARVDLEPGQSRVITFRLGESELGYFLPDGSFTFEPGTFEIMAGASSSDIRLQTSVELD